MDLKMPVTIVVKAPNQKIDDQTVECLLGWTVKKLKQHLSDVYPSQPKEDQQRIIYSGKLLHDHLKLKDILRKDDSGIPHTMHLVCSATGGSSSSQSFTSVQSTPDMASLSSETSFSPPVTPDGVRHRGMSHIQTQPNLMAYQHPYSSLVQQQTVNGHHYSQQQMLWMQQMYAHQMAQYMQYVQQGGVAPPMHMTPPGTPPPIPAVAPQVNQPARPAQGIVNPPNQNVRMNAQGGPVMDDDDEEGARDWLDWVYIMSRAAVLFAILYFYSTFGRFVMVFGFFILIWLYNIGLFRINRRQRRNEEEQPPRQQDEQQQQNQQQNQQDQQQDEQVSENASETSTDSDNATQDTLTDIPARPGVLKILLTFFRTFFTSLLPENPQLAN